MSAEDFGASIEAYTYPDEFGAYNGEAELGEGVTVTQQKRTPFGLSYQTKIGSDTNSDLGYKIHFNIWSISCTIQKAPQYYK